MTDWLTQSAVACADQIAAARWAHCTALADDGLAELEAAGYVTVTNSWATLTPAGWELFEDAVA